MLAEIRRIGWWRWALGSVLGAALVYGIIWIGCAADNIARM
jgi:hypothetical protein